MTSVKLCITKLNNIWFSSDFIPKKKNFRILKKMLYHKTLHQSRALCRDFEPPTPCVGGDIEENCPK